ncbi:MAG: FecR domain-containing protein [Candidatus Omnitrophota bacterium]
MRISNTLCVTALIALIASVSFSAELKRTAAISEISGEVMVKGAGPGAWAPAKVGDQLNEGFFIKTGPRSKAVVNVDGDSKTAIVDVSEKSLVSFATLVKDSTTGMKKTLLDLSIGQVLIKAEKLDTPDSKFEVKTPTSVVGVRGTKFSVKVDALK